MIESIRPSAQSDVSIFPIYLYCLIPTPMLQQFLAVIAALLLALVSISLWRAYSGYTIYKRAAKAFGADKVLFVNRTFEFFAAIFKKQPDSLVLFTS